jgi:hypothetical protein
MHFVRKYLRMKHIIVFQVSHNVILLNFYDYSKIILSAQGLAIAHIDKSYVLMRWILSQVMMMTPTPSRRLRTQSKSSWHECCWIGSSIVKRYSCQSVMRTLVLVSGAAVGSVRSRRRLP